MGAPSFSIGTIVGQFTLLQMTSAAEGGNLGLLEKILRRVATGMSDSVANPLASLLQQVLPARL
ncbi:hypothetical protein EMIT0P100_150142 [Pseudomonas sp. IT-P100]